MSVFQSADAQIHYQTFGDPNAPALVFSNSLGDQLRDVATAIQLF